MIIGAIGFAACVGLLIGAFLTVLVYRIPYGRPQGPPGDFEEEEFVDQEQEELPGKIGLFRPRHFICPDCEHQLPWSHVIPLLGWAFLRGRCGFCHERISFRYPIIEIMSAVCCVAAVLVFGASPTALVVYLFLAALIVVAFIDIDYYIIPDVISLPATLIGLALAALSQYSGVFGAPLAQSLSSSLLGVLVGGGGLWLISEVYLRLRRRIGLGFGDMKMLAMTGAFFGVDGAVFTIFAGSLIGSVLGLFLMAVLGKRLSFQLPFGPFLAVGTALYIFTGPRLMSALMLPTVA